MACLDIFFRKENGYISTDVDSEVDRGFELAELGTVIWWECQKLGLVQGLPGHVLWVTQYLKYRH